MWKVQFSDVNLEIPYLYIISTECITSHGPRSLRTCTWILTRLGRRLIQSNRGESRGLFSAIFCQSHDRFIQSDPENTGNWRFKSSEKVLQSFALFLTVFQSSIPLVFFMNLDWKKVVFFGVFKCLKNVCNFLSIFSTKKVSKMSPTIDWKNNHLSTLFVNLFCYKNYKSSWRFKSTIYWLICYKFVTIFYEIIKFIQSLLLRLKKL